ncbi:MAG: trigger factor [Candidatus Omnitrophota bacterium]|jgi:FKBP-type peptidyl-prolyl cis-trans isomerase (trigger factor)
MKSEVKKVDNTKREISIEANGDVIKNKFDEAFKDLNNKVKVKGFRPGHIPRDVLEKKFSSQANELVLQDLIPELCDEAIKHEGLQAVALLEVSDVKLDRTAVSFKAQVEVRPEIDLKNYKGLTIHYKKVAVAPDEVKRSLDSLKEMRRIDTLDDAFARSMGYPGLAELEKVLERRILSQKDTQNRQQAEQQILEHLSKGLDVKLPPSLVSKRLQELVKQTELDLALKGVPREKLLEEEKNLYKDLEPDARKQVQTYLIFAEIAKRENIPDDDHMSNKVMEFLFKEANWELVD